MPEILDWQQADPRSVVSQAIQLLEAGRLVAFPTEAEYTVTASALIPDAVLPADPFAP